MLLPRQPFLPPLSGPGLFPPKCKLHSGLLRLYPRAASPVYYGLGKEERRDGKTRPLNQGWTTMANQAATTLTESIRRPTTFLLAVFLWLHALLFLNPHSAVLSKCAQLL